MKSVMTALVGTETITTVGKLTLINGHQCLIDGLLNQSVNHGGDSQLAYLAIILGYIYPTDGIGTVATVKQRTY